MKIASIFGGLLLLVVSLNTHAWTGTGNENIDGAREFMRFQNENGSGASYDFGEMRHFIGKVEGLSNVFNEPGYKFAVCYPEGTNGGQLFELAANYLIENPSERQKDMLILVWQAHVDAFGKQQWEDCYKHDRWLEVEKL